MKFLSRSLLVLVVLYGMVFALGTAFLADRHVSLWWALLFSVGFIGLQFAISPWLIEWVYAIDWDENELPAVNRAFVDQLCMEHGLTKPRIGVIQSGTPNAFSFGRVRSDARVVVTKGLLDVLTPEEANAVIAHEIGHIEHYDFAVMAIAALVPLIIYQIYVWTRRNNNIHGRAIAGAAYVCYWVGQYLVLTLNRTREYYADHFSAEVTRAPGDLSSALIKIAYGMVRAEGEYQVALKTGSKEEKKRHKRQRELGGAISLLGIANLKSSQSLALSIANPQQAAAVMRWDLVNPWARFYQLNSTHPLTAFRVRALNSDSEAMHQEVRYPLPAARASDRKLRFLVFPFELILWLAPWACGFLMIFGSRLASIAGLVHLRNPQFSAPWLLIILGTTWMLKVAYRYRGSFQTAEIGSLLEDTDVSQMQPRAVQLRGEIVGRGVPGAFWSADLVLRDETGMIFLLYRSSIPFARFLFAITNADQFIGEQVTLQGWFRRGLQPYVELSKLTATVTHVDPGSGPVSLFGNSSINAKVTREALTQRSYSRWIQYALAAVATAAGIIWLLGMA